jgi:hypothetical protein
VTGKHEPPTNRSFYLDVATSTLRALILAGLVIFGILGLTKLFPVNTSLGVTPAATQGSKSPTVSPTNSPTPSPGATRKPRAKSKVTIQVMNGTSRAFFGAQMTSVLKDEGYKTVEPGTYRPQVATTIIYYQPDFLPEAQRLKRQRFQSAALKPAPATLDSNIDIQVILGQDVAGA